MAEASDIVSVVPWKPVDDNVFGHDHDLVHNTHLLTRRKMRRMAAFLRAYRVHGTRLEALKASKVSITQLRSWMHNEPLFAAKFENMEELNRLAMVEKLEREALRRGVKGVRTPLVSMGQVVTYVNKYSDKLLEVMLRAKDPEHYAPKVQSSGVEVGRKEDGSSYVKAYVGFNPDDV